MSVSNEELVNEILDKPVRLETYVSPDSIALRFIDKEENKAVLTIATSPKSVMQMMISLLGALDQHEELREQNDDPL